MQYPATKHQLTVWARHVKESDRNMCVLCGRKPNGKYWCRLEAHHIKPKADYPQLATDPTNGVSLCRRCHNIVTVFHHSGEEYPPLVEYIECNLRIVIPKGLKQAVEAHAKSKGESINGLVNALLRADMGLSEAEWKAIIPDAPSKEE